jgi:hypothetical protein
MNVVDKHPVVCLQQRDACLAGEHDGLFPKYMNHPGTQTAQYLWHIKKSAKQAAQASCTTPGRTVTEEDAPHRPSGTELAPGKRLS